MNAEHCEKRDSGHDRPKTEGGLSCPPLCDSGSENNWGMTSTSLKDESCFEILNGLWKGKKPPFIEAGIIRNTNFTEGGQIDYADVVWLQVEQKQFIKRQLRPGDIIVERSGGGPKQPVGRVVFFNQMDGFYSFSNFTSAIRVRNLKLFYPMFVFYFLLELYQRGQTEDIQRRTTGIRNLDFTAYKKRAIIPQISLPEQKKIAAILGLVQQAIEQQERLIALTTELKKSLLHQLFTKGLRGEPQKQTEIGPVPESWEVVTLGEVTKLRSGGTPARDKPEYWVNGNIPWVKTGEIDYCVILTTEESITRKGLANSAAKIFPKGTLLMAMYGQGVTRGRVGLLGIDAATNQACASITPHKEHIVSTQFIYHYIEFHYKDLRMMGHGANQRNLNTALIKGFHISIPKPDEQAQIIETLGVLNVKLVLHQSKYTTLTALFRTLLHQLMTAQIRVDYIDLAGICL